MSHKLFRQTTDVHLLDLSTVPLGLIWTENMLFFGTKKMILFIYTGKGSEFPTLDLGSSLSDVSDPDISGLSDKPGKDSHMMKQEKAKAIEDDDLSVGSDSTFIPIPFIVSNSVLVKKKSF